MKKGAGVKQKKAYLKFLPLFVFILGILFVVLLVNLKNNAQDITGDFVMTLNNPETIDKSEIPIAYYDPANAYDILNINTPYPMDWSSATNIKCTDYDADINVQDYILLNKSALTSAEYQSYLLNRKTFGSNIASSVLVTYTQNGVNRRLRLKDTCTDRMITYPAILKGTSSYADHYNYVTEYFCDEETNKPTFTNYEYIYSGKIAILCNSSVGRFPAKGEIFYDAGGNVKFKWMISNSVLYEPSGYNFTSCTDNDKSGSNLGINFTRRGTVTARGEFKSSAGITRTISNSLNDYCGKNGKAELSTGYVTEYVCQNGKPYKLEFKCPNGCIFGRCRPFSMADVSFPF